MAKPASTRQSVAQTWVQSSPVLGEGLEGREDPARRRHEAALGKAGADGGLPGEGDEDRQQKAEKHARIDRAALLGKAEEPRERRLPSGGGQASGRSLVTARSRGAGMLSATAVEKRRSTRPSTAASHVRVGRNHARLLEREAGGQDRVDLRLADGRMGELGALELPRR